MKAFPEPPKEAVEAAQLADRIERHMNDAAAGAGHKWLYLIRHGWDWDNIDRAIKGGGLSNLPLATVCEIAVKELMEYRGKPIKGKPL